MPWIGMYLLEKDIEFLSDWLSQDEEIAFLLSDGPKQWIAQKECDILNSSHTVRKLWHYEVLPEEKSRFIDASLTGKQFEFQLWHVPAGSLPLLGFNPAITGLKPEAYETKEIDNPWLGWTEIRTGANDKIPFFASHPGAMELDIYLNPTRIILMSGFQWVGNYFKVSGYPAQLVTEKFWRKLRNMTAKVGHKIPRENRVGGKPEIFAFPQAYQEILNGRPCALNPS